MRIKSDINPAGVVVFVANFLPGLAAIVGAEDAALGVRPEGMPEGRNIDDVRIRGIDDDPANRSRIAQADVLPGLAPIERFVDSVTMRDVATNTSFASPDINNIGIGGRNGEAADRRYVLLVEDGSPSHGAVGRFPDASAGRAEIVRGWISGNA